jgi:hypothetical protein
MYATQQAFNRFRHFLSRHINTMVEAFTVSCVVVCVLLAITYRNIDFLIDHVLLVVVGRIGTMAKYLSKKRAYPMQKAEEATLLYKIETLTKAPLFRYAAARRRIYILQQLVLRIFWKSIDHVLNATVRGLFLWSFFLLRMTDYFNEAMFFIKGCLLVIVFALVIPVVLVVLPAAHLALFVLAQMQRYSWLLQVPAISLMHSCAMGAIFYI